MAKRKRYKSVIEMVRATSQGEKWIKELEWEIYKKRSGMTDSQMREIATALYGTKGRVFGVGFEPRSGKQFRMMNAHGLKTKKQSLQRLQEDARCFLLSVMDITIHKKDLEQEERKGSIRRIPLEGVRYFRCGEVVIDNRTPEQKALHPDVKGPSDE